MIYFFCIGFSQIVRLKYREAKAHKKSITLYPRSKEAGQLKQPPSSQMFHKVQAVEELPCVHIFSRSPTFKNVIEFFQSYP